MSKSCWNCRQSATHVFTRQGSNILHVCDNCTRIDRAEAKGNGWTVAPQPATEVAEEPSEAVCASCGHGQPVADTIPNLTLRWEPIGDERVCQDADACFRRKHRRPA